MSRNRKRKQKKKQRSAAPAPAPASAAPAPEPAAAPAAAPARGPWLPERVVEKGWILVAVLAVVLRAAYYAEHRLSPFFNGLVLDAANYDKMGWALAQGEGFGDEVFTFNPLMPGILGTIYAVVGHDLAWPRLLLLSVDVLAVMGIYAMTRALAGTRAALAAGLLAAAYRPAIFYAGELLAEGWVLAFAIGGLAALVALHDRWWGRLLAGLGLGLATLGRPNLLLFFPALLAWWAWELRAVQPLLRRAAPLLLGVGLVLSPVTVRNTVVGGDTVLVTAHGGVNLFIGNNPGATGWFTIPRGTGLSAGQESLIASATAIAEREAEQSLSPSAVSRHWQGKALAFMAEDPGDAAALMARKAFYTINAYEKPMVSNVHFGRQRSVVLGYTSVGYGLILLLGLVGMVEAWADRRRWAPVYLFTVTYAAGVVLFFVSMRYRLPMAAALLPFAGLGASTLAQLARVDRPKLAMWAVGLLGAGLVVGWPSVRQAELDADMAHTHYYLGGLAFDNESFAKAAYHYGEALAADPDNARYKNRLARTYLDAGREPEGIVLLEQVIKDEPYFLSPYLALAKVYRKDGRLLEAEKVLRQAVRYGPRYHYAWNNLGNILMDLDRAGEAVDAYAKATELEPRFLVSYQGLDRAYTAQGQRAAMRPHLERARAAGLRHSWVDETLAAIEKE